MTVIKIGEKILESSKLFMSWLPYVFDEDHVQIWAIYYSYREKTQSITDKRDLKDNFQSGYSDKNSLDARSNKALTLVTAHIQAYFRI